MFTLDNIKQNVLEQIEKKYKIKFDALRARQDKEEFSDFREKSFDLNYDCFGEDGELYYLKIWGDLDYYLYSLSLNIACESNEEFL